MVECSGALLLNGILYYDGTPDYHGLHVASDTFGNGGLLIFVNTLRSIEYLSLC